MVRKYRNMGILSNYRKILQNKCFFSMNATNRKSMKSLNCGNLKNFEFESYRIVNEGEYKDEK